MKPLLFHSLKVHDLSLKVRLGHSPEERKIPQEVRISIELRFHEAPKAIDSDKLEETVCYGEVSDAFQKFCAEREFLLIEKLTYDLFQVLSKVIQNQADAAISVHKVNPPVPGLIGGAVYRIGTFQ